MDRSSSPVGPLSSETERYVLVGLGGNRGGGCLVGQFSSSFSSAGGVSLASSVEQ